MEITGGPSSLQYQKVDVHIVRPIARPIAFKMSGSHLSIPSIIVAQSVDTTKITLTANYCEPLTI